MQNYKEGDIVGIKLHENLWEIKKGTVKKVYLNINDIPTKYDVECVNKKGKLYICTISRIHVFPIETLVKQLEDKISNLTTILNQIK